MLAFIYLYRQYPPPRRHLRFFPEHFKRRTPSHTYGAYVKVSDMGFNHRLDSVQVFRSPRSWQSTSRQSTFLAGNCRVRHSVRMGRGGKLVNQVVGMQWQKNENNTSAFNALGVYRTRACKRRQTRSFGGEHTTLTPRGIHR